MLYLNMKNSKQGILWKVFICVGENAGICWGNQGIIKFCVSPTSQKFVILLPDKITPGVRLNLLSWQREVSALDSILIPQNNMTVG